MKSSFTDGSLLGNKQERGHMCIKQDYVNKTTTRWTIPPNRECLKVASAKSLKASDALTHWVIVLSPENQCTACIGFTSQQEATGFATDMNEKQSSLHAMVCTKFKAVTDIVDLCWRKETTNNA